MHAYVRLWRCVVCVCLLSGSVWESCAHMCGGVEDAPGMGIRQPRVPRRFIKQPADLGASLSPWQHGPRQRGLVRHTPHAIDLALQLPRSPPSFLALLSFSSWLLFPFLSLSLCLALSPSLAAFLALPPFNLLFCSFLDVTEICLHCISCTQPFGFIFNLRLFLLSQTRTLYFMHHNSKHRIKTKILLVFWNGRPSYSHPSDEGLAHTNGILLHLS